jgi:non-ribosomal peptide synthetase component E (peptide arylation enzyme)
VAVGGIVVMVAGPAAIEVPVAIAALAVDTGALVPTFASIPSWRKAIAAYNEAHGGSEAPSM